MPKMVFTQTTQANGDGQTWNIEIREGANVVGNATLIIKPDQAEFSLRLKGSVYPDGVLPPLVSRIETLEG